MSKRTRSDSLKGKMQAMVNAFQDTIDPPAHAGLMPEASSNLLHMIQAVNSDTELVLADNVNVTLNNVTYQIQVTVPDSMSDGVRHMVAINTYIVQFLQNMDKWMSQNGMVAVTLPNGQKVALQSIKALQDSVKNAYPKTGGKIDGEVYADNLWSASSLELGDVGNRKYNGIKFTGKDGAGFDNNSVEIQSWHGIGFKTSLDNKTNIYVDTRKGNIGLKGAIHTKRVLTDSIAVGDNCGMDFTGVDGAGFNGNNLEIRSWFGVGFYSTQNKQTSVFFNTRNGDIATKGTI
ncbi:hypothetical protein J8V57_18645 [Xenorhabdus sp. PB61.4]|uniref:tail fiber protein n=1 Tax=Xenorhabdus sp. PB61.4 TaxID=2788940 RepID=UPI001E36214F|nr:tail fiber protein [Xenorhabdus sp. PB61.4]MCC8368233.1 hypothetical protein [Xenorhabdus sp. PB61.4]